MGKDISAVGFIPARLQSTRLERKLLIDLCGKPVLQRTWEGAKESKLLQRLIIATDSEEIVKLCKKIGADFVLTPMDFASGTDRIIWAYKYLGLDADFILNIQGDEPFVEGELIDRLILGLKGSEAGVSTLVSKIEENGEIFDPSVVKVVCSADGNALYFSRSPIPFIRDSEKELWHIKFSFYKHIGIYCFRREALETFSKLPQGELEIAEKLEQLRLLENGIRIHCIEIDRKMVGIDTAGDLEKAKKLIQSSYGK